MSARTFRIAITCIVLLLGACTLPFPGALISLLFQKIFLAIIWPDISMISYWLGKYCDPFYLFAIRRALAITYGICVALSAAVAWAVWRREGAGKGRVATVQMLVLVAIPLAIWLSAQTLMV